MRNVKVSISVGFTDTEEPVTPDDSVERTGDGSFNLVLDYRDELNIDRLENGLLQIGYPALRDALSGHLEKTTKKKPVKNSS